MPLSMDPEATFEVVLDSDLDKPLATRPTFIFGHMTCRDQRVALDLAKTSGNDGELLLANVVKAVDPMLKGWRHMTDREGNPIEYEKARFGELVTLGEASELLTKVSLEQSPDDDDKKK